MTNNINKSAKKKDEYKNIKDDLEIETNVPPNVDNAPRELHNNRGTR